MKEGPDQSKPDTYDGQNRKILNCSHSFTLLLYISSRLLAATSNTPGAVPVESQEWAFVFLLLLSSCAHCSQVSLLFVTRKQISSSLNTNVVALQHDSQTCKRQTVAADKKKKSVEKRKSIFIVNHCFECDFLS